MPRLLDAEWGTFSGVAFEMYRQYLTFSIGTDLRKMIVTWSKERAPILHGYFYLDTVGLVRIISMQLTHFNITLQLDICTCQHKCKCMFLCFRFILYVIRR